VKFKNRKNGSHKLNDGRTIWESRSVAVVIAMVAKLKTGEERILLCQRGPGCPDEIGKWCMPCGYLDWDETLIDGARREVYEETGINVDEGGWKLWSATPWQINSKPHDAKQNVSMYYLYYNEGLSKFPAATTDHCEPEEISAHRWMDLVDAGLDDSLAFRHADSIKGLLFYMNKKGVLD
jgi:8-oxo-dGTP pyrophosphatase MutT (NUDIX family)